MTTSQCSLALPTDSIHPHKMNSPIVINEWSSASSASASPSACRPDDRLGERVSLNEQQLPEKLVHHALTDSIHTTCSLETQLYNEEEKFIAECLAVDSSHHGHHHHHHHHDKLLHNDIILDDFDYDRDLLQNPYFYTSCTDYDCELAGGGVGGGGAAGFNHSPILSRGYSRHARKLDSDPTIILTLLKWARVGSSQLHGDDDQIDRINYQFTSVLLLILLTLTGFRQYLSHLPLQCWIPQEFSRSWEEYAEHYCWVTNTYFSNLKSNIPPVHERTTIVRYYQWATFVFILQAAGFFLPCLIWRLLQNHSGFHVQRIMRSALRVNCTPSDSTQTITDGLARYIDNVIYHRSYKTWRVPSSTDKSRSKQKISRIDAAIKSVQKSTVCASSESTTSSHETGTETKLVKFEKRPTSSSYQYRTLPSETTTLPRSHKKSRAPQPPVTTSTTTPTTTTTNSSKLNSDQIIYTSNLVSKPSVNVIQPKGKPAPRRNPRRGGASASSSSTSLCCNKCGLCFTGLSNFDKSSQKSVLEQPLVSTSKVTSKTTSTASVMTTSTNQTNTPKLQTSQTTANQTSTSRSRKTSCWPCCSSSPGFFKLYQLSQRNTKQTTHHKPKLPYRTFHIKKACYQFCYGLWLCLRCLLTLICLLPACSCHWLCGSQKIKGFKRSRSFLFYLYVTVKLLYLVNIFAQLYLMKVFLGVKSYFFGIQVLRDLINGNVWSETGHFPRVTYCDFEAKKLGKNYKYTLQCVLPLNLFLEKVYIFLWFWIVFVGVLTFYSLLKWLSRLTIANSRITFVTKFLYSWNETKALSELNPVTLKLFVHNYLNLDGVFLLWLISINAGDLIISDLIIALWNLFEARLLAIQSAATKPLTMSITKNDHKDNTNSCAQPDPNNNGDFPIQPKLVSSSTSLRLKQTTEYDQQAAMLKPSHAYIPTYHTLCPHSRPFLARHESLEPTVYFNTDLLAASAAKTRSLQTCYGVTPYDNNNNNNNNICRRTDIFESSDSIV